MSRTTKPFAAFEWMIAWRYIRAKRREGGVSVMTWISLIGIALAVFALTATLAVRSGFRVEFTGTILGANAHSTVYMPAHADPQGVIVRTFSDYEAKLDRIKEIPEVVRAAGIIKAQVMASGNEANTGVEVYGETLTDLKTLPLVANPEVSYGAIDDFDKGVAIGTGIARELGLGIGDVITLISPDGLQTAFGTVPRVENYEIVYIFQVGRYDIDSTRLYMPLKDAQVFFNREDQVDQFEIMVANPDLVDDITFDLMQAAGERSLTWTWLQSSGSFLRALKMEDNIMFVILSILVLLASMNIVSGLIMLVKNKTRDVGILRTVGLTEGSILRVFFICGASIGVVGTLVGVIMGCLFAIYIDPIFDLVNYIGGGGVWDPERRLLSNLPAKLVLGDVLSAVALSLGLSFTVTILPARRAARMNPVEALRNE